MAKEALSANPSVPLHEVLEAEFGALHGKLPPDYPSLTEPNARLTAIWAAVHALPEKRAAFCISGGGIRSATFGLGILQGLARCGLLDRFHYLSTVSGGGYIGSWLSAWIKNDPQGIDGVVEELRRRPDSTLNPEPQSIRHLREYSNYLAPRAGLTSVDFWTLITTFIRNMFLNWLVLISWLAAAMMIPRLYLAAINLQPDWIGLSTKHSWQLLINDSPPDWDAWGKSVRLPWNVGMIIMLVAAFALIAMAMAYAIIDVPSTGNARFRQRQFLKFRQIPLFVASLILAACWAIYWNVYGKNGAFQNAAGLVQFILFFVFSYVCGGFLALLIPSFRKSEHKARPGSVWRLLIIFVTTVFAGFCLWGMATRMFLDHRNVEFTLTGNCEAIQIPSGETIVLPKGTTGEITKIIEGTYTVGIVGGDQETVRIAEKDLQPLMAKSTFDSETRLDGFTFIGKCRAIEVPSESETLIEPGASGEIIEHVERNYTVETDAVTARIAKNKLEAFELNPAPGPQVDWTRFRLKSECQGTDPKNHQVTLPAGSTGVIRQIGTETYTVKTDRVTATIPTEGFDLVEVHRPVPAPANHAVAYVCFAPALIMAVVMLVNFLFTGLASWLSEDEDREWWARSAAWIVITIVGWLVVNAIVVWGGQAITASGNQIDVFLGQLKANPIAKAILGTFGGVSGIAGTLLALRSKLGSKLGIKSGLQWPLVLVAVVFFVLLAVVISWLLLVIGAQDWVHQLVAFLGHMMSDPNGKAILLISFIGATAVAGIFLFLRSSLSKATVFFVLLGVVIWWVLLLTGSRHLAQQPNDWRAQLFIVVFLMGLVLVFGIVMGFLINANKFSLHATYRNRLIRAYLAASRLKRRPNLFTGFDPNDNFELYKLSPDKPLHLLNGTLNLVKGEQLAWQERKAESFTMSRLHCGSFRIGYRPSREYGHGITLGTALAISGAAANPNMGYHSSPVLGLLMTLFNMRLGWWLGNPGPAGRKTWTYNGPSYSVGPLFSEAVGNTTDHYKYVNLSDGGHFENLGLYEMVLRRCHWIVVSDAGEDPECSFADLGEAVRKIRIDFGIPIEFGPMTIYPRSAIDALKSAGQKGHNCAIGRIRYSAVDPDVDGKKAPDGVIIYIKPTCYGEEPRDIYEYFKRSQTFPHESTADQFFSESQFESYRMLGAYTMGRLCADCGGDFRSFTAEILRTHLQIQPPDWLGTLIQMSPTGRDTAGAA
jgi:hypothetical protein